MGTLRFTHPAVLIFYYLMRGIFCVIFAMVWGSIPG